MLGTSQPYFYKLGYEFSTQGSRLLYITKLKCAMAVLYRGWTASEVFIYTRSSSSKECEIPKNIQQTSLGVFTAWISSSFWTPGSGKTGIETPSSSTCCTGRGRTVRWSCWPRSSGRRGTTTPPWQRRLLSPPTRLSPTAVVQTSKFQCHRQACMQKKRVQLEFF